MCFHSVPTPLPIERKRGPGQLTTEQRACWVISRKSKLAFPLSEQTHTSFLHARTHARSSYSQLSQTCGCLAQHFQSHHQMQRTINGGLHGMGVTEKQSDLRMKQRAQGEEDAQGRSCEYRYLLRLQEKIVCRWIQQIGIHLLLVVQMRGKFRVLMFIKSKNKQIQPVYVYILDFSFFLANQALYWDFIHFLILLKEHLRDPF